MASPLLRVVTPEDLKAMEDDAASTRRKHYETVSPTFTTDLIHHIRTRWEIMRNHRASSGIDQRFLAALRTFNGQYAPEQLNQIRLFGGSEVFARVTAGKCRSATALLRDIYFGAEKPWELAPTPDPQIPEQLADSVVQLVQHEVSFLQQNGMPVDEGLVAKRMSELMEAARRATVQRSRDEARKNQLMIDDFLEEGGFYDALKMFLVDLPLFPYAVMKGPFVRIIEDVVWNKDGSGGATIVSKPKLVWERVSPMDFYFSPGAGDISYCEVAQRMRWSRKDLNDLIGLPGWDENAIRLAIHQYDNGLRDWIDTTDSQRAIAENREDPNWNRSDMIDALEFHGPVRGETLLDIGFGPEQVPDPDLDYQIEAWIVGDYLLKVQTSPSPRKRHPYWLTSYEKVPGTPIGNALPDLLDDVQDVANAALRNLVNNMSISSGPQVVVLDNRFAAEEDTDELYPWKRWHMCDEPGQGALPPVSFYQPNSNAQELMGIYKTMTELADEISAIPKYSTGLGAGQGAGRTASGLSMLMDNASKMLQQVAANIDGDIIRGTVQSLYDLLMLTTDKLRGDESIIVHGVDQVIARASERQRQLEFLQITANPMDGQIVGLEGRAVLLRELAKGLGLDGEHIVPSRQELAQRMQQAQQAEQAQAAAEAEGGQSEAPADETGPRTNAVQTRNAAPGPGGG